MIDQTAKVSSGAPTNGLLVAAPTSGSGKTLFTLGLIGALIARGLSVAPAKVGPDYIDGSFHRMVSGRDTVNLDAWAMSGDRLRHLANRHAAAADLMIVEGVMGLFDGAANGQGSSADVAEKLGAPIVLVIDAARQSQSVAALANGFMNFRPDINVAGVVLNRVASLRHEAILRDACQNAGIRVFGALPNETDLKLPSRHLGLVQAHDLSDVAQVLEKSAHWVAQHCDLDGLEAIASPMHQPEQTHAKPLPSMGQNIAVAMDAAFSFIYPHMVGDWQAQGATISVFSPLADDAVPAGADVVFLPGGYPELHAQVLSNATNFIQSLKQAEMQNTLVYGECGGYMVLGENLTDKNGVTHQMAGLLPLQTRLDMPKRVLGYRHLSHKGNLPLPSKLLGHEFHYSSAATQNLPPLFEATDALGTQIDPMGMIKGRTMGSYAHIIDADTQI